MTLINIVESRCAPIHVIFLCRYAHNMIVDPNKIMDNLSKLDKGPYLMLKVSTVRIFPTLPPTKLEYLLLN